MLNFGFDTGLGFFMLLLQLSQWALFVQGFAFARLHGKKEVGLGLDIIPFVSAPV